MNENLSRQEKALTPGRKKKSFFLTCSSFLLILAAVNFLCLFAILQSTFTDVTESAIPESAEGWRSLFFKKVENAKGGANDDRGQKLYRIVACAKVSQEEAYLLEWIEFHRLQGVDKFALYYDGVPGDAETVLSGQHLSLLPNLYDEVEDANDLFDIVPTVSLIPDGEHQIKSVDTTTSISHRLLQPTLLAHCVERYRNLAHWILHIDVDEFLYSPNYNSAWEFLKQDEKKWYKHWYKGSNSGFYVSSMNFGSSGQIWDFHTAWFPDVHTGHTVVKFDPRDSTTYRRSLTDENLSGKHVKTTCNNTTAPSVARYLKERASFCEKIDPPTEEETCNKLYRLDDTNFQTNFDSFSNVLEFSSKMRKLLNRDYPTAASNLTECGNTMANFESPELPTAFAGKKTIVQPTNHGTQDESVLLPNSQMAFNIHTFYGEELPLNDTVVWDLKDEFIGLGRNDDSSVVFPRVYEQDNRVHEGNITFNEKSSQSQFANYLSKWLQYYPLIIEEQTRRGPSYLSDLETRNQKIQILTSLLCYLRPTEKCKVSTFLPNSVVTKAGKSIYRTASMVVDNHKLIDLKVRSIVGEPPHQNGDIHSSARLRGCRRPGVHRCNHPLEWNVAFRDADPKSELRIDHHQFRSYERRTFKHPEWRGGPFGVTRYYNYTEGQIYYNSIKDETKSRRWAQQIKINIGRLRPTPHYFNYYTIPSFKAPSEEFRDTIPSLKGPAEQFREHVEAFTPKTVTGFKVGQFDVFTKCSPLDILGHRRAMCPKSHPYVGFTMPQVPPPNIFTPYGWCIDKPFPLWGPSMWIDQWPPEEHNNFTRCPGFPFLGCCNYDPNLVVI